MKLKISQTRPTTPQTSKQIDAADVHVAKQKRGD